jgi:hypothetical protein
MASTSAVLYSSNRVSSTRLGQLTAHAQALEEVDGLGERGT